MRTYIVRGYEDGELRFAVIVTTPGEIGRKVKALRWSQVTEPEVVDDHITRVI